jgi:hypothetical protein
MPMLENPRPPLSNLVNATMQGEVGKGTSWLSVLGMEGGERTTSAFLLCCYHYRQKPVVITQLHCQFKPRTGSDMDLHCRFFWDPNYFLIFKLKIGSEDLSLSVPKKPTVMG